MINFHHKVLIAKILYRCLDHSMGFFFIIVHSRRLKVLVIAKISPSSLSERWGFRSCILYTRYSCVDLVFNITVHNLSRSLNACSAKLTKCSVWGCLSPWFGEQASGVNPGKKYQKFQGEPRSEKYFFWPGKVTETRN